MASPFVQLTAKMDRVTAERFGKAVTINGQSYTAVESHLLPEMGPVQGDGVSLVVFSLAYSPRRNDNVVVDDESYIVTRHQLFNGKPQIWLE